MITNATQLEVAMERLHTYQRMLESLRADLREKNSSLFPLMSEGYIKRIEGLQEEIVGYLRERPAESPLSVRLSGPFMKPGIIKATLASNLISGLQSALYQVGRTANLGDDDFDGSQETKGLQSRLSLNLIATAPGSFILAMDLAPRQQLSLLEDYDAASSAVEKLIEHVNDLQESPQNYAGGTPTLRGLQKVAVLVRKDIETIEIIYRDRGHLAEAKFDSVVRERIEQLLGAPRENEKTIRGTLIEINIKNNTCKVEPEGGREVIADYEEGLEDDLITGVKRKIEMAGQFTETGTAGNYRITRIERFKVLDDEDLDAD